MNRLCFGHLTCLKTVTGIIKLVAVFFTLIALQQSASASDAFYPSFSIQGDIGRKLNKAEEAQLQTQVFSDGEGLPEGGGSVTIGKKLYITHCSDCHGQQGEGASAIELTGDRELLNSTFPDKGIGVYWPFTPTLFAYIQRAMPPAQPNNFTTDELYSIVAYVLHLNDLIPENTTINKNNLAKIKLPNRDGFTDKFP